MNGILVMLLTSYLPSIQTENIAINPGEENLYSIVQGDTIKLLCPVNSSTSDVVWAYMKNKNDRIILSKGDMLNTAKFRFSVAYTSHLKQVIYLRIYNITWEQETIFLCSYNFKTIKLIEYEYNIQFENVTNPLITNDNGIVYCVVQGKHIKTANFIWEQRTLFNEPIRFIKRVQMNCSRMSKPCENFAKPKSSDQMSCLNTNINGILKYNREGKYICIAELFIDKRNEAINRTASLEIENIQDRPFCIQHTRNQRSIPGANTSIGIHFYSKPKYLTIYYRKDDNELDLKYNSTVSEKNISLDIYNVTVTVSGYEIIIHITEFSENDVGNYTVDITNGFGYSNCTVRLLPTGNEDRVEIEHVKWTKETKHLQWYIVACASLIVICVAMSALRSTLLKTVKCATCSEPTILKPCFDKSIEEQANTKRRRAYSDNFTEVTLNQLQNGERILRIGQTNGINSTTESNI